MKSHQIKVRWVAIGMLAIVAFVYVPVLSFDFINFDDNIYVTGKLQVLSGLTWDNVIWSFVATDAGFWQPLTWLSLMMDYELYGLNAGGYHLTNVLIHLGATLVLFLAFYKMTGALWRSALVAALFALHPLHVESVAWISERKDVLSGFFWMLTLYAYAEYAVRPGLSNYSFVLIAFTCGLMSKAMVVTLPFVLLLIDFWPLRRFEIPTGGHGGNLPSATLKGIILEKIPLLIPAIIVTVLTFYSEGKIGALKEFALYPLDVRISNALISYVLYIWKMIWSLNLAIYYPHPARLFLWPATLSAFFLVSVTVLFWRLRYIMPYALTGWFWYLGTLLPVIGIVQIGDHAMADRYSYIPLVGLFIIVTWGGWELLRFYRCKRTLVIGLTSVILIITIMLTANQLRYWSDSTSIFRHSIAVTTENYISHYNLGVTLKDKQRYMEAESQFSRAIAIEPAQSAAWNNLGVVLSMQGKDVEAAKAYRKTLELKPEHAGARNNLGVILYRQGDTEEAITHFREAIRLHPDYANAHYFLGLSLKRTGFNQEAKGHIEQAVKINQYYAQNPTGYEK